MLSKNSIDCYTIEYANTNYIDCYFCKIIIMTRSLRCSIIDKYQVLIDFVINLFISP